MCKHTYICAHVHTYVINIYRPIYICAHVHADCIHMYYVHASIYACVYNAYVHIYVYTYIQESKAQVHNIASLDIMPFLRMSLATVDGLAFQPVYISLFYKTCHCLMDIQITR